MSTPEELLQALGREARAGLPNGGVAPAGATTRTYRGRTVEDIIPLIQRELGSEAIIVRRRDGLTGGVLGFFQHPFVEVEAMPGGPRVDVYDEPEPVPPSPPASTPPQPPLEQRAALEPPSPLGQPPASPLGQPPAPPSPLEQWPSPPPPSPPRPRPVPPARPPVQPPPTPRAGLAPEAPPGPLPFQPRQPSGPPATGSAYVTAHLAALARADRSGVVQRESPPERPREPQPPAVDFHELIPLEEPEPFAPSAAEWEPAPRRPAPERRTVAPGSHARARAGVEKSLRRYGISEELAGELMDGAAAHTLPLAPRSGLAQAVRTTLAQRIPVAPPLPTAGAAIVVVGAGGAGKTTCCAALLGAYRKGSTLPASCATLTRDPNRGDLRLILAPQIMKPTLASTPRALRALRRARSDGLAVLDTPRLSPADKAGIRELALLLGELKPERIVVALPATLGSTAAAQLLAALRPLGANALAVTHADETDQIGVAIEAACRFGLAPEYMLDRARSGGWRLSRIDPTELASKLLQ